METMDVLIGLLVVAIEWFAISGNMNICHLLSATLIIDPFVISCNNQTLYYQYLSISFSSWQYIKRA